MTPDFAPQDIGRLPQIEAAACAVTRAMPGAGIPSPADAHHVQVKCRLLTRERMENARRARHDVATEVEICSS